MPYASLSRRAANARRSAGAVGRSALAHALLGALVLMPFAQSALGADRPHTRTFTLTERIDRGWSDERVSFTFDAKQGRCHPESVALFNADGDRVPVQLTDIETWADSPHVKSAKAWFVTDLPALTQKQYTLRFAPDAINQSAPMSDLRVRKHRNAVTLTTDAFGVRVLHGAKTYDTPRAADDVPGPVRDLRLSDGTWFGSSRLYGPTKVVGYEARLIEAGPVFAKAAVTYRYEGGHTARLIVRLAARQREARWAMHVNGAQPKNGIALNLSRDAPDMAALIQRKSHGRPHSKLQGKNVEKGAWGTVPLDTFDAGDLIARLTPFADHWRGTTAHLIRLRLNDGPRELRIRRWDAGAWVEPKKLGTLTRWGHYMRKAVPAQVTERGLEMRFDHQAGARKWRIGEFGPLDTDAWRSRWIGRGGGQVLTEQPDLNEVKDYALDWPGADDTERPTVLFGRETYEQALKREPDAALKERHLDKLKERLAKLGETDKFRATVPTIALYDAVMATDMPSAEQRALFRAQLAYLAYRQMHPSTWSIERGYRTYNFNMSAVHGTAPGLFAAAMPKHPMAEQWAQRSIKRVRYWLDKKLRPDGVWPESLHYTQLSATMFLHLAVATRRAGFADLFANTRLNEFGLYLAQQFTPADPMYDDRSVSAPVGRGAGGSFGFFGEWARATAQSDPAYSRHMQWLWKQTGYSHQVNQMKALTRFYLNEDLPAEPPEWSSRQFADLNYVLRNGVGSGAPHYVNLIAQSRSNPDVWPPETGRVARWYAHGDPIGGAFRNGYHGRHELIHNGVMPARQKEAGETPAPFGHHTKCTRQIQTLLPRQDYIELDYEMREPGTRAWHPKKLPTWPKVTDEADALPIEWRRRVLFIKGRTADAPHYLVMRDIVATDQPTMWQFWTYSRKLGSAQAATQSDFLDDAPGEKIVPPRRIEGDRFTAVGQFDTNLEYFIAEPRDTPRHTLRWGDRFYLYDIGRGPEYQDLLHLQRPGRGAYHVVLFPRPRQQPAPAFTSHADGRLVKIDGEFGTDYVFLSDKDTEAQTADARFDGTVGSVQDRGETVALSLGAYGSVRYGDYGIKSNDLAVSLGVRDGEARIVVASHNHERDVAHIWLPDGEWTVVGEPAGVTVKPRAANRYSLVFEQQDTRLRLQRAQTDAP